MSISNVRPVAPARPIVRANTVAAKPATTPRAVAPSVPVKAQGPIKNTATGVGAAWGTAAGVAGGAVLGALFAISGGGSLPLLIAGAGIGLYGAVLGGFGGNRIGAWIEKGRDHQLAAHGPSVANVIGGTLGAVTAACGGFWATFYASSSLGLGMFGAPLMIAGVLGTAALGAIGGGAALQGLVDKLRGK